MLLIVQALGGALAAAALALFMLLVVAFGAILVAFGALIGVIALVAAVAVALVGQSRLGDPRWRVVMVGLEVLVVAAGIALETYLLLPTRSGVPPPPTLNVVLALVLPVLALANLGLMVANNRASRASP